MRTMLVICLIMLIGIPVFAVFQLIHRIENNTHDPLSDEKFYNSLREAYGKSDKPKRALTDDERIALARKISEDPFADVKAADVMEEFPEEEEAGVNSAEQEKSEQKAQEAPSASEPETEQPQRTISREQALAMVSGMLGDKGRNKKGRALSELQATMAKYKTQMEEKQNNTK